MSLFNSYLNSNMTSIILHHIESIPYHIKTTSLYLLLQVTSECTSEIAVRNTHALTDLYLCFRNNYIKMLLLRMQAATFSYGYHVDQTGSLIKCVLPYHHYQTASSLCANLYTRYSFALSCTLSSKQHQKH